MNNVKSPNAAEFNSENVIDLPGYGKDGVDYEGVGEVGSHSTGALLLFHHTFLLECNGPAVIINWDNNDLALTTQATSAVRSWDGVNRL